MDSPDQFLAQRVVNGAVPRNTSHSIKRVRRDLNPEMTLPAFLISRMTPVFFAFVHNFQKIRSKGRLKFLTNFIFDAHFSHLPPSISAATR